MEHYLHNKIKRLFIIQFFFAFEDFYHVTFQEVQ